MAKPFRCQGPRFWWIAPTINGRQVPESSGETDYGKAERRLKILEGKTASNSAIRLFSQETKNRKPTVFPLTPFPELRDTLQALHQDTKETEKRKEAVIPYVFHRDGKKVRSVRTAWNIKAGVPGRLIHDLRRTADRDLKSMGFSDTEIMQMVGFKTLSIMHRYNITTEEETLAKGNAIAKRVLQRL